MKIAFAIFALLTVVCCILAVELIQQQEETSAYRAIVLSAMNGDARFTVGNEAFECRGGSLGNIGEI